MKLLALRAAQFRRFGDGVAVEGLSPSVNVLAGPNELGKSTLFEALEAAFLVPHGTTGARLEAFRPRVGGEPLVEVDFEIGGARWRIRKQFGRGKTAVLSNLDSGRIEARAGEAEAQLAHLVGTSDGPGRIGLVWVRQQRALHTPDPDIEPLTGKQKTRGETNALMSLLSQEVVEAAGSKLGEDILSRARAELGLLMTPGRDGAKRNGPYDLALRARNAARDDLARAQNAAAASEARLARIGELSVHLRALEDPRATTELARRIDELSKTLQAADGHRERRARAASDLKARQLEAQAARDALQRARAADARELELVNACAFAESTAAHIKVLADAFNANTATQPRLSKLENARVALMREQEALEGMSTFVEIAPVVGAEGIITADGAPVLRRQRLPVPERMTIDVKGVGTIRVISSDADRAAEILKRRDALELTITQLLDEMGVSDDAQARAQADARNQTSAQLDALRMKLTEVAPKGLAALHAELSEIKTQRGLLANQDIVGKVEAANDAAIAAQTAYDSVLAEGLDEDRYRTLLSQKDAAQREATRRTEEVRRTSEQLERLRGEQAGIDEDGRAGEVEMMSGLLEQAEAEVRRWEADIAALKLLTTTLARNIEDVRALYLEPVANALMPYLAHVFPGAGVTFREGFAIEALMRAGEREMFSSLSDGTREQLAVLVRMGFAELFASRSAPVPLVLDDPLVYSDDERLNAMCGALNRAGQSYQIVVLTCRKTAFAALEAKSLTLKPWSGT